MLKLEEVSGLSNADPIHRYLKVVDGILAGQPRWDVIHRKLPMEKLLETLWVTLGHPVKYPKVEREHLEHFRVMLAEEGEPVLSEVVGKLMETEIDAHGIRMTMMFILVNIEYLKETEGGRRSIDSGWLEE